MMACSTIDNVSVSHTKDGFKFETLPSRLLRDARAGRLFMQRLRLYV